MSVNRFFMMLGIFSLTSGLVLICIGLNGLSLATPGTGAFQVPATQAILGGLLWLAGTMQFVASVATSIVKGMVEAREGK